MTTFPRQPRFPQRAAQRGVVLLIALIFLVLLTLIAIGASSGSLLQQRMVAATRSGQLATMSANTALRGAEWNLWSSASKVGTTFACGNTAIDTTTGCVKYDPDATPYSATGAVTEFRAANNDWLSLTGPITYKGTNSTGFTGLTVASDTGSPNVAADPQYIIEDLGLVKPPGAGPQVESGATGPGGGAVGANINLHIYRITARATGGTQNVVRVVQSTFDAQTSN